MYREVIVKVLTNVPIFKDISTEGITKLAYLARISQYSADSTVFNEGDPGDCLYIIASGKAEIYTRTSTGDEIRLKSLGVADVFGEMALLDGLPRSATVRISEKSILFYINRTDFNLFLVKNPDVALRMIETISRRLRDTNTRLREVTDEKEGLMVALQETYNFMGEKEASRTDRDEHYHSDEYSCPYCDSSITTLKINNKFIELEKDDGFCPRYKELNPLYYEIAVCPKCGYAFSLDTLGRPGPQDKIVLTEKLRRLGKPADYCGPRSLDQAIETFNRAFLLHDDRNIGVSIRADLCLKLAWLYKYKEDGENEKKYLMLALQRLLEAHEEERFDDPQKDINIMYMIGQTHLNTGNPGEALKWFARITQHPQKQHSPQLVDKARDIWMELKQGGKKK